MAKPRSMSERVTYVLEKDRILSPDEQTRFILRPLSALEQSKIEDQFGVVDGRTGMWVSGQQMALVKVLLLGLEEVQNYKDADGNDLGATKFAKPKVTNLLSPGDPPAWPFLDFLTHDERREIANAILKAGTVEKKEAGN